MVDINNHAKVAKRPEDRPIDASGWCGLCLYNIPQGTLIVLIPGVSLLLIGIILVSVWPLDQVSLMMTVLGMSLTVGSITYWIVMWYRYKPQMLRVPTSGPVQLIGIYKIPERNGLNGRNNPAFVL